jgi:kynurenine formamidase
MSERRRATEDELRGWLDTLSNWGRWGPDDELGTLNYLDGDCVARAARLVESGEVVSCAIPIDYGREPHSRTENAGTPAAWKNAPIQFVFAGGDLSRPEDDSSRHANDAFLISPHGSMITHLDAPSHMLFRGRMYNGIPSEAVSWDRGAEKCGIEVARHGIVGRGVLLDVPRALGREWLDDGEEIYPEDLEAAARLADVRVGRGDILLVRTGYRGRNPGGPVTGRPGLQAVCLPWLREREVAVLCSDVTQDVRPHGYRVGSPIHTVGIWALGLWLLDNCYLEDLAEACERRSRWEFLLSAGAVVFSRSTGSPVNPLAIF